MVLRERLGHWVISVVVDDDPGESVTDDEEDSSGHTDTGTGDNDSGDGSL